MLQYCLSYVTIRYKNSMKYRVFFAGIFCIFTSYRPVSLIYAFNSVTFFAIFWYNEAYLKEVWFLFCQTSPV